MDNKVFLLARSNTEKDLMINEDKILKLLNDEFKCSLVEITQETIIKVTSPINASNLIKLIEFCKPLNYNVRFDGQYLKGLLITPN